MSLGGIAARGAAASLGAQGIKFLIQMIAIVILARLLVPEDYGLVAMVSAIVGVAVLLSDFGLSMASIQAQDISRQQKTNLFWLNLAIGIVLSAGIYLLAGPISALYGDPRLVQITQVLSITFLLSAATTQFRAESSRRLRFKAMALADVTSQAVSFGASIVLALVGFGYWALVAQQVLFAAMQLLMLGIAARWFPGLPRRGVPMRELVTFGINTSGVQFLNYVSSNVDTVLIGRFNGPDMLGLYNRAYQFFRLPLQQLAAPMTRVAFPILSKLNGKPEYDAYIQRAQLLLTYVLGGMFFIAVGISAPLIDLLLGDGWDLAKGIFAILSIGGVFQAMGYVYYWVFLSRAMTGIQLRFQLISRTIMIALMCVGVIWGPYGVAAGSSLGLIINWIILSVFALPRTGVAVGPLIRAAMRPIGLYAAMLAISSPVILLTPAWNNPVLELLAIGGTMLVVLGVAYLVFSPIRRDARLILRAVGKLRKR